MAAGVDAEDLAAAVDDLGGPGGVGGPVEIRAGEPLTSGEGGFPVGGLPAASGGQAAPGGSAAVVGGMVQSAGSAAMGIDPCAFRLEYNDPESLIPMCTCAGYAFDLRSFRCLPGGG